MDNQNNDPKQGLLDRIHQATNILVTVSNNPTVDELAACVGLTLWLNKLDKHATAVFSGNVPSTIEFLQPEETLEKTTDSLRDFIIALDKSKADKLRYKVEDRVVKIFITPYRTSLTADDLEFSQGDFNVDLVLALGVTSQADLDAAITAHGRILHDATVATVTVGEASDLGSINWRDDSASSLSELAVDLGNNLNREQLDGQIATSLLTGIVASTARFSNDKTTPQTMSISAELMSAGANQQLVASKLSETAPKFQAQPADAANGAGAADGQPGGSANAAAAGSDGTLEIEHAGGSPVAGADNSSAPAADAGPEFDMSLPPVKDKAETSETSAPEAAEAFAAGSNEPQIHDVKSVGEETEQGLLNNKAEDDDGHSRMIVEPPSLGGTLTASVRPNNEDHEGTSDPLSEAEENKQPLLSHDTDSTEAAPAKPIDTPPSAAEPAPPAESAPPTPPSPPAQAAESATEAPAPETLADIEREVHSPHLDAGLNEARDEVQKALDSVPPTNLEPIQALNAQPMDLQLGHDTAASPTAPAPSTPPASGGSAVFDPSAYEVINDPAVAAKMTQTPPTDPNQPVDPSLTAPVEQPYTLPLPSTQPPAGPASTPPASANSAVNDPTAPPPVPPPLPMV